MHESDTIVAVATPKGESALAMLRATGPECESLCRTVFKHKGPLLPRHAYYDTYRSVDGESLDDVVYCFFKGPRSFTGEDILEISCHGNPLIATRLLEDLIGRGCRQSEPGEFSRRAFENGRIDLTQAEAVMELIQARSDKAIRAANNQLRGALGRQLNSLRQKLIASIATIEAYIDFPEEDLPPEEREVYVNGIQEIMTYCSRLIDSGRYAAFLRDGIKTLILGEPNAGKSSLLNALLGFERAIVSRKPGTTRDFLRERLIIGPHSIQLLDTAGLRTAQNDIEQEGIRRTIELAEEADIFLVVEDSAAPSPVLPDAILSRLSSANCILIRNKIDLGTQVPDKSGIGCFRKVDLSALTGEGIDRLRSAVVDLVDSHLSSDEDDLILVNARHSSALSELRSCLESALAKLESDDAIELIASDMRGALDAIGSVLGKIDNETVLDELFSTFCIGK